jgi:hypothetical protein
VTGQGTGKDGLWPYTEFGEMLTFCSKKLAINSHISTEQQLLHHQV